MANTKSAAKRARQSVKRNARNTAILTGLKSAQRKLRQAITTGKTDEAKTSYVTYTSSLDKAAKRGAVHKNLVARRKSRLSRALKKAAA